MPGSVRERSPLESREALGQSEVFLEFQERLSRVAAISRPVLLVGERGTGKELAAVRLHYLSRRWQGPLVSLNCAALNPALLESELFGHEVGAFTGALKQRTGRFEAADGGTLFLDEIGSIPMEVQEKILRVVEYGSFERVGGSVSVEVDARIIGATHADLIKLAEKGRFKRDLLDRLSFEVLTLPPLRERAGDILFLADHFARRMAYELGREKMPVFKPMAKEILLKYPWPGNIRELKNVVERAVYRSDADEIVEVVLDPFQSFSNRQPPEADRKKGTGKAAAPDFTGQPLKSAVRELEIHMIRKALESTRYNQKRAATVLGLTYDQFRGIRRKYREVLDA